MNEFKDVRSEGWPQFEVYLFNVAHNAACQGERVAHIPFSRALIVVGQCLERDFYVITSLMRNSVTYYFGLRELGKVVLELVFKLSFGAG